MTTLEFLRKHETTMQLYERYGAQWFSECRDRRDYARIAKHYNVPEATVEHIVAMWIDRHPANWNEK